jgi:hypothetical protein
MYIGEFQNLYVRKYAYISTGGHSILQAITRRSWRQKMGIEGSGAMDWVGACCCPSVRNLPVRCVSLTDVITDAPVSYRKRRRACFERPESTQRRSSNTKLLSRCTARHSFKGGTGRKVRRCDTNHYVLVFSEANFESFTGFGKSIKPATNQDARISYVHILQSSMISREYAESLHCSLPIHSSPRYQLHPIPHSKSSPHPPSYNSSPPPPPAPRAY